MQGLTYSFCDDWLIFAKDSKGQLYMVSTEMWDGWLDLPDGAELEENAIEKYALPYALDHWDEIDWVKCPKGCDPFPHVHTLGDVFSLFG